MKKTNPQDKLAGGLNRAGYFRVPSKFMRSAGLMQDLSTSFESISRESFAGSRAKQQDVDNRCGRNGDVIIQSCRITLHGVGVGTRRSPLVSADLGPSNHFSC